MADQASLTFSYFLKACEKQYPIVPLKPHEPLTSEQARNNYSNVAQCTFETHYGKPYWVPQLIDDVDVCRRALGAGWQLPTHHLLHEFNDRHRQLLREALKHVPYGGGYNSLLLYGRDERGKLTFLDLSPPEARNPSLRGSMYMAGDDAQRPLEVPAASLRCIRDARHTPAMDVPPVTPEAATCGAALAALSLGKNGKAPRALRPTLEPEPEETVDPALVQLSQHANNLKAAPESFDPNVTLSEVERALPAAMRALERGKASPQRQIAQRLQRAMREIQNPNLSAAERDRKLTELHWEWQRVTIAYPGLVLATREERVVRDAGLTITAENKARYARALKEYERSVPLGKPLPGAERTVAALQREVAALRKLQEKVDELTGNPISDWLVLPPKPKIPK